MDIRGMLPRRMVVGISGASGVIYGVRLLQLLRKLEIETHLVMSRSAQVTLAHESDFSVADIRAMASVCHSNTDIGASISSGSFPVMGMIVAPCSIKTLSEIATGMTSGLLSRAADVTLIDPNLEWTVKVDQFDVSSNKNRRDDRPEGAKPEGEAVTEETVQ